MNHSREIALLCHDDLIEVLWRELETVDTKKARRVSATILSVVSLHMAGLEARLRSQSAKDAQGILSFERQAAIARLSHPHRN